MARSFLDESYNPDRYDEGWQGHRDDVAYPPIDPEDFEREQSLIQELVEREMKRTLQNVQYFAAPWSDQYCRLCKGRKQFDGVSCPDCMGTGAESYVQSEVAA